MYARDPGGFSLHRLVGIECSLHAYTPVLQSPLEALKGVVPLHDAAPVPLLPLVVGLGVPIHNLCLFESIPVHFALDVFSNLLLLSSAEAEGVAGPSLGLALLDDAGAERGGRGDLGVFSVDVRKRGRRRGRRKEGRRKEMGVEIERKRERY